MGSCGKQRRVMAEPRENQAHITFRTYNPFEHIDLAENIWELLQEKCRHSFFSSWGWVSTWIRSLPAMCRVQLIVGYRGGDPVLAFFIGANKGFKYRVLPTSTMSLNATAQPRYDSLYIEYNTILYDESAESVVGEFKKFICTLPWDELVLPGLSPRFARDFALTNTLKCESSYVLSEEVCNSYWVELEKIRTFDYDYFKLLSANKRSQIRRSIKQYELDGELAVEESATAEEAIGMYEELAALHQFEWKKRGEPGAFSNEYFYLFHRELIRSRFKHDEIQLLRIRSGTNTIGILYSFVYQGEVLFYQSGFRYSTENVHRPGLVSHYLAVLHNARKGMKTYDFLAGDSAYKSSLSTDSTTMCWVKLVKNRRRLRLEKNMLGFKRQLRSLVAGLQRSGT
jgi:hypothetical protein